MKTTNATKFAVITKRDFYGPSTAYHLLQWIDQKDGREIGDHLYDSEADALAAIPAYDGPIEMSHNQYGESTAVYAVLQEIEPSDWGAWPSEMMDAACSVAKDNGIDAKDSDAVLASEIDWKQLAAEAIGCCVVQADDWRLLLCRETS